MPKSVMLTLAYGKTVCSIEQLKDRWQEGKDFVTSDTKQYCSIRNEDLLKRTYDYISICGMSDDRKTLFECGIWQHPLAGLTTYV